ncbi:hypothetical protein UA08_06279 [Talaromyces atroroseus]|uniref:Uncharacterized protein n=1 Tax=Talaromyces atroroseus TaxID=1441469 RepID=A0A225ABV7_TALAT|nr:hypothetical protein UA08_06279 [Talaromyces atroroseus]OKL58581.1 hypothetical protein UA08_06279 [Talaromyces atroroseus]
MEESSRLSTSRTFPVNLHHRHRSEAARPTTNSTARSGATEERQPWPRRLFVDTSVEEQQQQQQAKHSGNKSHRYSKSRDYNHRLPRAVNQIASAGGARNLLPNRSFHHRQWSQQIGEDRNRFKDKYRDREGSTDFSFLRPTATTTSHTHESSRSRCGSRSPSAQNRSNSRAGSLVTTDDSRLSLTKGKEIKTMEDLNQAREERKKGEEYLRTKLASVGTRATEITRRLDYTYYNLLDRMSALNSTIHTFHGLVDSTTALHDTFQRDNTNLEQDTHRQLEEFQNFEPQRRRIEALEERMKAGRCRMETLGNRLDTVRKEIEGWERREGEWQARVSRRLRMLWGIACSVVLVLIIAYGVQSWRLSSFSQNELNSRVEMLSRNAAVHTTQEDMDPFLGSLLHSKASSSAAATSSGERIQSTSSDPLHLFDEL